MNRIVVVTKSTRLENLISQHMTHDAARFYLESVGQSIKLYEDEDLTYQNAIAAVFQQLPNDVPLVKIEREAIPNFLFRDTDFIIVCGPDGLFVNLAKYIHDQPVLTVNPDPSTVAGVLMLFEPSEVGTLIKDFISGNSQIEHLPLAKAMISEDEVIWGVNDIFIGRKDHISARYEISFSGRKEHHYSSGVIVSTGVGSTGWLSSVHAMVNAISSGGQNKLANLPSSNSNQLVFVAREPFKSPDTGISIVTGRITPGNPLQLTSEMPSGGYIFSDGVIEKALPWNAGSKVTVSVGEKYVKRIVG